MEKAERSNLFATARALVVDRATVQAADALAAAGLRSLLLRGPALAGLLYDTSEERRYGDADLLVDPAAFGDAEAALRAGGLTESLLEAALPVGRPAHAHTWQTPAGGTVDLHRTLVGIQAPAEVTWRALARDAGVVEVDGRTIETPSVPARALVIALHAAHHVDEQGHVPDDLERALERLPLDAWRVAAALAREVDGTDAFARGLVLSPRGRELLAQLGLGEGATADPPETGARAFHVAQGLAWLATTPGLRAKAEFVRRRLLPTPRTLRARSSLARRGTAGLLLAYLFRWLDALRHLPAAVAALLRSRR